MRKFAYLLLLLLLPIVCTGQYRYEISVDSFNGVSPKKAYSLICKNIEFTNRKVVGDNLIFESKNEYTREQMEQFADSADYELSFFNITPITNEISIKEK
jgi:hypothetical protein